MTDAELLTAAKVWLRDTSSTMDVEITQTIAACKLDLTNGGVVVIDIDDALTQQAIKLYLKAQFGYDDKADKYAAAYEHVKAALALSGLYNVSS